MSHSCPARGCDADVDDARLMCRDDWYRVPRPLRSAVNRAYSGGRGLGTAALLRAQQAAIQAVNRNPGEATPS